MPGLVREEQARLGRGHPLDYRQYEYGNQDVRSLLPWYMYDAPYTQAGQPGQWEDRYTSTTGY